MADNYWIDIYHGRPKGHHYVNDYDIVMPHARVGDRQFAAVGDRQFAAVGKKYRLAAEVEAVGGHHHHSHSRRYWGQPLFYIPDYGDVAINSTATDPDEIPDAVEGLTAAQQKQVDDAVKRAIAKGKANPLNPNNPMSLFHGGGGGILGDIVHSINTVTNLPRTALNEATHIPVVGDVIHAGMGLDPTKAIGGIVSSVARGERLDHAFLEAGKAQLAAIKEVAPYVQTVMSFVPGVGTGVAAAIAAGTALAEGRSISDAVISGLSNAIPGGSLGKTAFSSALAITHGDSISSVAMNAIKQQLPPNVQNAVDTAIAASKGKNVREAVLQAVRQNLPPAAQKALDIGIATGIGRTAQSKAAQHIQTPVALSKMAAKATPPRMKQAQPRTSDEKKGFDIAVGILHHKGVTPTLLWAARSKLNARERAGFDHAIKAIVALASKNHTSLVRGGLVTRGNWKKVTEKTKGAVPGRLVHGKTVTVGHFVRV